jgi:ABC-type dipeptide/oligopeptide/nickel transport system permease component
VKSSIFIILEFIAGFVFGVLGGYAFSFFDRYSRLDTSIVLAFTSAFIALLLGVAMVGYIHLRRKGKTENLGRSILFSLLGLIVFLMLYIVIELFTYPLLPYYLSSFLLPIMLPLTGAVLGFNFKNFGRRPSR